MNIAVFCAMALLIVLLSVICRELNPALGRFIAPAGGVLLLTKLAVSFTASASGSPFSVPQPYDGYIAVALRCVGCAALVRLCCDFARDLGEAAIAEKLSLCGRCVILTLLFPLLSRFLSMAKELLA